MQGLWVRDILSSEKEKKVRPFARGINNRQIEGPGASEFLFSVTGQGPGTLRSIRYFIDFLLPFVPSHHINDISLKSKQS